MAFESLYLGARTLISLALPESILGWEKIVMAIYVSQTRSQTRFAIRPGRFSALFSQRHYATHVPIIRKCTWNLYDLTFQ